MRGNHLCVWLFSLIILGTGNARADGPEEGESYRQLLSRNALAPAIVPDAALRYALEYYDAHASSISNKDYVSIVDYSVSSREERLHVIDMHTGEIQSYLAAHGIGSGESEIPTRFSNRVDSHMTSLGIYLTAEEYQGDNGTSMKLDGMESTNSRARERTIVFHAANYASRAYLERHGQLGYSWGCIAVDRQYIEDLVRKLKDGSVMYVYSTIPQN